MLMFCGYYFDIISGFPGGIVCVSALVRFYSFLHCLFRVIAFTVWWNDVLGLPGCGLGVDLVYFWVWNLGVLLGCVVWDFRFRGIFVTDRG